MAGLLTGKGALVTGGGSGIGLASVRRLGAGGARIVVVDVNDGAGEAAASETSGWFVRADVSDPRQVTDAFRRAEERLGQLDVVHLNAGVVTGRTEVADLTDDEYRRVTGVNVDGVVFGAREAVR